MDYRKKESERFLSYLKIGYEELKVEMENRQLTSAGVEAWISHLPTETPEDPNSCWDEEVYTFAAKIHKELNEYLTTLTT